MSNTINTLGIVCLLLFFLLCRLRFGSWSCRESHTKCNNPVCSLWVFQILTGSFLRRRSCEVQSMCDSMENTRAPQGWYSIGGFRTSLLFGMIGSAAVSDLLHSEVNMPAIGYFVLLLLLIKNRNQGWRTNRGNSLLSFKCLSDATDSFTSSES